MNTTDTSIGKPEWISTPTEASAALAEIKKYPVAGYDSEFDGVNIASESCVGKSKLDVFSIAIPTSRRNPLGYFEPKGFVFDAPLINEDCVKSYLENPSYSKTIHNRPVDEHTAFNAGVRIRGGVCTLSLARFLYPERANLPRGNYDLDSLCRWRVSLGKTEGFDELLGYDDYVPYTVDVPKRFCLTCESFDCRKKKAPHDIKQERLATVTRKRLVRKILPLVEIRPGHPLFERYLTYASVDAELALILYQMMLVDGQRERFYPWGF